MRLPDSAQLSQQERAMNKTPAARLVLHNRQGRRDWETSRWTKRLLTQSIAAGTWRTCPQTGHLSWPLGQMRTAITGWVKILTPAGFYLACCRRQSLIIAGVTFSG
jgi:hypothetical protein